MFRPPQGPPDCCLIWGKSSQVGMARPTCICNPKHLLAHSYISNPDHFLHPAPSRGSRYSEESGRSRSGWRLLKPGANTLRLLHRYLRRGVPPRRPAGNQARPRGCLSVCTCRRRIAAFISTRVRPHRTAGRAGHNLGRCSCPTLADILLPSSHARSPYDASSDI